MSRELDAQVAERVMDGIWLYHPVSQKRSLRFDAPLWKLKPYREGDVLTEPDGLEDVPRYSMSLDACAKAEARIVEMGLTERYGAALWAEEFGPTPIFPTYPLITGIARIPADVRCRAMLAALTKQKQ